MYTTLVVVKVGVRELRAGLSAWLERVKAGDEVVVTERGRPVARLVPTQRRSRLEQLVAEGRVTPPSRPKTPIDRSKLPKIGPGRTVAEVLVEMREQSPY